MIKICEDCGKENKSNYVKVCQKCYNARWFAKGNVRVCKTCGKDHKTMNINCYSCTKRIRESKRKIVPCTSCQRTDVKIRHQKLCLCVTCFRKKCEQEIPGFREKRILYNRQAHRKYRGKDPVGPLKRNPSGYGHVNKAGYKIITKVGHPNAHPAKGMIPEHVFIMSKYLGRALMKGENVHHKNGMKSDNRLENLELWNTSQPSGQRIEDKIKWAKEFLISYGYEISCSKELDGELRK